MDQKVRRHCNAGRVHGIGSLPIPLVGLLCILRQTRQAIFIRVPQIVHGITIPVLCCFLELCNVFVISGLVGPLPPFICQFLIFREAVSTILVPVC